VSDLTGEIIDGRYQLTGIVASGGMATIYSATDLRLDRQVAVKIMHPHLAQDEKFVERFIREAKAAAALSHPNIVSVLDQGWNQGGAPCVFIVMELVEGATLRDYLSEQGALPIDRVIQLVIPVASALAAAHRLGIVHRDIKPENILVSKEGRIKIADFGLARGALLGSTMTAESSVILGSVSYLSPEQVKRGIADSRSDVYSLGIVIFELLTGQKPFSGDDPVQIAISHVNSRVPAPSSINPKLATELDLLVLRATDVDPDKRPRDCGELLEELRALSEKLDPRKRQLSLELDLPPLPLIQPVRERSKSAKRIFQGETASTNAKEEPVMAKERSGALKKRQISKRVRRNRRIAFGIFFALLVGGWYLFAGPGSKVIVPSLAGFTVKDARGELKDLGLEVQIGQEEFSEDVAEGRIIKSDPAGGGRIEPNGVVTVTISKGKERFLVPNLIGLKPEVAQEQIDENKLVIGEVIEEFSDDYPKGLIIRTSPSAGERVKRDSVISLFISKGIEQIAIADYKGKSGEQALTELTEAGFNVESKYVFSEDLPPGAVISQTPGATEIDKGSKVTLFVSKGSEFVYIPKVVSLPRDKAIAILEDLELKVVVKRAGGNKSVIRISPSAGSKVKRGSSVTITVG
jgi:serine/threonine-protein kinase